MVKQTPSIKDFTSVSTEVNVDFTIVFPKGKLNELLSVKDDLNVNGLEKLLKLTTTVSTTNMHLFDSDCKLHKYKTVQEIIESYYDVRSRLYTKRKDYMLSILEFKLKKLSNKARYIQQTLDDKIDLRRKTAAQVDEILTNMKFDKIEGDYKYLVKMPMDSVTQENVDNINKDCQTAKDELEELKNTTTQTMWLRELDEFDKQYQNYKKGRENIQSGAIKSNKIVRKKNK